MDRLYINDLIVEGKHGVHAAEKLQAQPFRISVELSLDLSRPGQSDELDDTLNWSAVRDQIVAAVQNNSFNLVEKLADEIARQLLTDQRIRAVRVKIDKLKAFASGVPGVEIKRTRSS